MVVPNRRFQPRSISDGYRLIRLRGRGAFGNVWEAETPDGRIVAFKSVECKSGFATQEVRNALTVSEFNHPHLVRIEKVWCEQNRLFFVMELAEGSLIDLLDVSMAEFREPLSAEVVCGYLRQAAEAIDFLNARKHSIDGGRTRNGILHCDIKPSNILVFGDKVKLCDFGLATRMSDAIVCHEGSGSPAYAAPEIFQHRLSEWSDQYALAVSYCQLRGGLPFHDTPRSFTREYVRPAPDLSMLNPAEQPAIARALSPAPQDRWPDCREMMRHLRCAIPDYGRAGRCAK